MSAGLMEDHAAKAILYGHGHGTRLDVTCMQHGDCLAGSLPAKLLRVIFRKKLQSLPCAVVYAAVLILSIPAGNGGNHDPVADLPVMGKQALAGGDHDLVIHLQIASADLADLVTVFLRGQACLPHILDFLRVAHIRRYDLHRMDIPEEALPQKDVLHCSCTCKGIRHFGSTA